MTKPLDPDLKSIRAINRALNSLELPAQRRVLNWVIAFRLQVPDVRDADDDGDSGPGEEA